MAAGHACGHTNGGYRHASIAAQNNDHGTLRPWPLNKKGPRGLLRTRGRFDYLRLPGEKNVGLAISTAGKADCRVAHPHRSATPATVAELRVADQRVS